MKLNSLCTIAILIYQLIPEFAYSQINFQKTVSFDSQQMVPVDMVLSTDSGFVITMNSFLDSYIAKFNSQGNFIWKKKFSSSSGAIGRSIRNGINKGFLVSTYFTPSVSQGSDMGIIKLDSSGNVLWANAYGSGSNDVGYDAIQISNSSILLGGSSVQNGRQQGALMKIQSNGTLAWSKVYDDTTSIGVSLQRLMELNNGNFITCGHSNYGSQTSNGMDGLLIKTTSTGTMVWNKVYHFPEWSEFTDVKETSDGGFIVAGIIDLIADGINNRDFFLMKTDSLGTALWAKAYTRTFDDLGHRVLADIDGGFLITGSLYSFSSASSTAVMKVNASGAIQWTNQFLAQTTSPSGNITLPASGNGYYTFSTRQVSGLIQGYLIRIGNLGLGFCNDSTATVVPVNVSLSTTSPIKTTSVIGTVTTSISLSGANPVYNENIICIPSGIHENASIDITSCYPNPSSQGLFYLTILADSPEFECYDLCGKVVDFNVKSVSPNQFEINLYKSGCYLLKINSRNGTKSIKLMVSGL